MRKVLEYCTDCRAAINTSDDMALDSRLTPDMSTTTAADSTGDHVEPHIRLATPLDFDELADVALRAFIEDPVMNYFGSVKKVWGRMGDYVLWLTITCKCRSLK